MEGGPGHADGAWCFPNRGGMRESRLHTPTLRPGQASDFGQCLYLFRMFWKPGRPSRLARIGFGLGEYRPRFARGQRIWRESPPAALPSSASPAFPVASNTDTSKLPQDPLVPTAHPGVTIGRDGPLASGVARTLPRVRQAQRPYAFAPRQPVPLRPTSSRHRAILCSSSEEGNWGDTEPGGGPGRALDRTFLDPLRSSRYHDRLHRGAADTTARRPPGVARSFPRRPVTKLQSDFGRVIPFVASEATT
jgi:hypothetical protein